MDEQVSLDANLEIGVGPVSEGRRDDSVGLVRSVTLPIVAVARRKRII